MKNPRIIDELAKKVSEGAGCKEVSDFMFDKCKKTNMTFAGKNKIKDSTFAVYAAYGVDEDYKVADWASEIESKRESGTEFGVKENKRLLKEAQRNFGSAKRNPAKGLAEGVILENSDVKMDTREEDKEVYKKYCDLIQMARFAKYGNEAPYRVPSKEEIEARPAECFTSEVLSLAGNAMENKKSLAPIIATSLVAWSIAANENAGKGFDKDVAKRVEPIDNFLETYMLPFNKGLFSGYSSMSVKTMREEAVKIADDIVSDINKKFESIAEENNEKIKQKKIEDIKKEYETVKAKLKDLTEADKRLTELTKSDSDLATTRYYNKTTKKTQSKADIAKSVKTSIENLGKQLETLKTDLDRARKAEVNDVPTTKFEIMPSQIMSDIKLHLVFSNQSKDIDDSTNANDFDGKYINEKGELVSWAKEEEQTEIKAGNIYESFALENYREGIKRIQALYAGKVDDQGNITINSRFMNREARVKYATRVIAYLQAAELDEARDEKFSKAFADLYAENIDGNEDIAAEEWENALKDIAKEKAAYDKSKVRSLKKGERTELVKAVRNIVRPAGVDGNGLIKLNFKNEGENEKVVTYSIDKATANEIWTSVNYNQEVGKSKKNKDDKTEKYQPSEVSTAILKDMKNLKIAKGANIDKKLAQLYASEIIYRYSEKLGLEEVETQEILPEQPAPAVTVETNKDDAENS